MKRIFTLMAAMAVCTGIFAQDEPTSKTWSLTSVPSADVTNITADATNWSKDSKSRYCYITALNNEAVKANGQVVSMLDGLTFTISANSNGNLRLGGSTASLWMGDATTITIPGLKKGDVVKVEYMTSSKSATRTLTLGNVEGNFPATTGKTHQNGSGKVVADGDVTIGITGGIYFYSITAGDSTAVPYNPGGGNTGGSGNPNNPNDQSKGLDYTGDIIATPFATDSAVIWLAPDGNDATGDGSEAKPYFDLQVAVDKALPGTTIKMKAGTYVYNKRININDRNGTHDKYITLMCPNGRAVLDFSAQPTHAHSDNPYQGIRLTSSYWHFYKIDICNASDNGLLIERNKPTGGSASDIMNRTQDAHDNIIEFCNFYRNGDTGVQIKNMGAYNYLLNCDSYWNCDTDNGDADGFAPKISVGDGNYMFGCRAYQNSDDGYDVFIKKDGGFTDNKTIVMENCLAYENGVVVDANGNVSSSKGNANGFKMGSDQGLMNVVFNRCLAVRNGAKGFDQNHNAGDIIMNNCTGFTNSDVKYGKDSSKGSYSYKIYESARIAKLTNCIAINDNFIAGKDQGKPGKTADSKYGGIYLGTNVDLVTSNMKTSDSYMANVADYKDLIAPRLEDGSLPWDNTQFLHINQSTGSALIDAGTAVAQGNEPNGENAVIMPAIKYAGTAPDLGAFEVGLTSKSVRSGIVTAIETVNQAPNTKKVNLVQAFNGMVVVSVDGGQAADEYTINAYDVNGALLGQHKFNGTNTSIFLPATKGVIILKVNGKSVNQTIKAVMK